MPIAVPGSLIPGESAREPISARTTRPKRGSSSKRRSGPTVRAARSSAGSTGPLSTVSGST